MQFKRSLILVLWVLPLVVIGCDRRQNVGVQTSPPKQDLQTLTPPTVVKPVTAQNPQTTDVVPQSLSNITLSPTPTPGQSQIPTQATAMQFQLETYNSSVMGGSRTYGVCLPPGYEQNSNQRYTVIFLLHGGNGDPTDWFQPKGGALATLQQLYATGKLPPSIVITPDGNDRRGSSPRWDPQYIDGPNGNVSSAIGDELVQVVQSRYRTLPNPDFWAIGGLSSGGWGAVNVGFIT